MTDLREHAPPESPPPGSGKTALIVAAVALLLVAGALVPMLRSNGEAKRESSASVVVETAPPTKAPVVAASRPAPPECPQLDNPGGRVKWQKSADAGPWPTDGTVSLPKLGVSAKIVRVGVDLKGQMVVPSNAKDVAWLDQGPITGGRTQNLVLAGHINYSHVAGTFSRLGSMAEGDSFDVMMGGKKYTYKVKWSCLFDRNSDRAGQIMGYTSAPSATLISCGGVFDRSAGTHNKRIAVRAELVSDV